MNAVVNNNFTLDELIKKDKQNKQKKQNNHPQAKVTTGKGAPNNKKVQARKQNVPITQRIKNRGNAIFKKKVGLQAAAKKAPQAKKIAVRRQQQQQRNAGSLNARVRVAQRANRGGKAAGQVKRQTVMKNRRGTANNNNNPNNNSNNKNKQPMNQQTKKAPQQQQQPQQQQKAQPLQPKSQPTRLKVRNVDEKTVTEQDIHRLFSKQGPVIKAKFDKNQFGQYLGSATIVYERLQSAQAAIKAYNGAQLDDRVMTVEFDVPNKLKKQMNAGAPLSNQRIMQIPKVKKTANAISKQGKNINDRLIKQKQRSRSGLSAGKTLNVRGRKNDRK